MSLVKHVVIVIFVASAVTISRTNWDYVNADQSGRAITAVLASLLGVFLFWGIVWALLVLIWRGIGASIRRGWGGTRHVSKPLLVVCTLASFAGTVGEVRAYTYIPTQRDRDEIRACVNSAGPNTAAVDCVMPTINRIMSKMLDEVDAPGRQTNPSQLFIMIRSAGMICGLPSDPSAPVTPQAKPCLQAEVQKISLAVALGLRDALLSISPDPPRNVSRPAPTHSAELIGRATAYSSGYSYGETHAARSACGRGSHYWKQGCDAGQYEEEKFNGVSAREGAKMLCSVEHDADLRRTCERRADEERLKPPTSPPPVAQYVEQWLQAYDGAYTNKGGDGWCGNGVEPSNDGCRAGTAAWPRN